VDASTKKDDDDLSMWPDQLRELAQLIGRERTLDLADACGGLDKVYIPREPSTSHMWAHVLTPDEWQKVVSAYGGERIDLPRGVFIHVRKLDIMALAEQGVSHRQIALKCRVTERHVRRVLEGLAISQVDDQRQGKLF
jgi:hypothetical protein